ncbi:hypothetical protein QBC46DRAFT_412124 [Diplogelasinospora grovesii]|uniref:Uncharacterized protein n=1 Tax=Diplogelasinospora grovesii TaxID=303347 RepID=A0AAN6N152_9PEZI|nr:hypothetical protein QBC46DRAFT_412124 [Diplogelasinospora grovesii]
MTRFFASRKTLAQTPRSTQRCSQSYMYYLITRLDHPSGPSLSEPVSQRPPAISCKKSDTMMASLLFIPDVPSDNDSDSDSETEASTVQGGINIGLDHDKDAPSDAQFQKLMIKYELTDKLIKVDAEFYTAAMAEHQRWKEWNREQKYLLASESRGS